MLQQHQPLISFSVLKFTRQNKRSLLFYRESVGWVGVCRFLWICIDENYSITSFRVITCHNIIHAAAEWTWNMNGSVCSYRNAHSPHSKLDISICIHVIFIAAQSKQVSLCIPCLVEVATAAGKCPRWEVQHRVSSGNISENQDSGVNPVSLQTCTSLKCRWSSLSDISYAVGILWHFVSIRNQTYGWIHKYYNNNDRFSNICSLRRCMIIINIDNH